MLTIVNAYDFIQSDRSLTSGYRYKKRGGLLAQPRTWEQVDSCDDPTRFLQRKTGYLKTSIGLRSKQRTLWELWPDDAYPA